MMRRLTTSTAVSIFLIIAKLGEGAYIFRKYDTKNNRKDAMATCQEFGGCLLSIESKEKFRVILEDPISTSILSGEWWIGLLAEDSVCGSYTWDCDNRAYNWTNWDITTGEPNVCDLEKCVRMHDSKWKTMTCGRKYGFICEKSNDTGSSQLVANQPTINAEEVTTIQEKPEDITTLGSEVTSTLGSEVTSTLGSEVTSTLESEVTPSTQTLDTTYPELNTTETSTNASLNVSGINTETYRTEEVTMTTTEVKDSRTTSTTTPNCSEVCTSSGPHQGIVKVCNSVIWGDNFVMSDALRKMILKMKGELRVEKKSTQLYIRSKKSIYEARPSAKAIGSVGILFIIAVLVFVVLLDLPKLLSYIRDRSHVQVL